MSDKRLAHSASSEPGVTLRASAKEGPSKHPPASSSYQVSDVNAPIGKATQRRRRKTNHMASTVFNTDPDPQKTPGASSATVAARVSRGNSVKSHENIFGGGPEDRSDGPLPWRPKRRICQPRRKDTVGSLFGGGVNEPVSENCRRSHGGDTHRRLFGGEPGTDSAAVNRTGGGGGGGVGYEDTKEKLFGHVGPPPVLRALRRPGIVYNNDLV